ncbi:MAG TPA: hypothetical protein PK734_00935 [Bacteroidales bacterium]|nr:hypothetical protein [Bacteroidales bacterium]
MKTLFCICSFALVCITVCSQSIGDYRTVLSGEYQWSNPAGWEYFDGINWAPAYEYPCENSSPHMVTISNNTTIICDKPIMDIPLQNICIDPNSTLIVESKNIYIQQHFEVYGTLSMQSSLGILLCNTAHLQGTIIQDYSKTITVISDISIDGVTWSGVGTTQFSIQGNLTIQTQATLFSNCSFEVFGKTYITTDIQFTTIGGEKIFHDTVFVENSTWTNTVGETFTCNSSLIFSHSTIQCQSLPVFTVAQDLLLISSNLLRNNDFYTTFTIQGNCIIPAFSTSYIESACFEIQGNCNIYGELQILDKKGVKTIYGSFIIHETGILRNNGIDRLLIYGNIENYGSCMNGTNGVFQLLGTNKHIYGNIKTPRMIIDGTYTNNSILEVTSDFSGTGVLTQAEHAELIIQSPSSPHIKANATGNIVSYTRGGNQYIECDTFYILKAENNRQNLFLQTDITILHQLLFTKACFIHTNGFDITFCTIDENTIGGCSNFDRGIILTQGNIHLQTITHTTPIVLPTFVKPSIEGFAGIGIQKLDTEPRNYTIRALDTVVASNPQVMNAQNIESGIVGTLFSIDSESSNTKITFYWHQTRELAAFERYLCAIMHFNGTQWHMLEEPIEATTVSTSIYSVSATATDFSPFIISSNAGLLATHLNTCTIQRVPQGIELQWETLPQSEFTAFTISVSENGIDFTQLVRLPKNTFTYTDTHLYNSTLLYYAIECESADGTISRFPIQSISIESPTPKFTINQNKRTIYVCSTIHSNWHLYSLQGLEVLQGISNTETSYLHLLPGIYLLKIADCSFPIVIQRKE